MVSKGPRTHSTRKVQRVAEKMGIGRLGRGRVGTIAVSLDAEIADLHDAELRRGALGCHDWAELEKTDRKMVESSLELADGVETA